MPKVSRVGKARQTAAAASLRVSPQKTATVVDEATAAATTTSSPITNNDNNDNLSRGQKKRLAKRAQYSRKEGMILASLQLKKKEDQAKRIDGLDALKEALLETVQPTQTTNGTTPATTKDAPHKPANLLKTNKSRQKLYQRESQQLSLVLQHPAFTANPLATIRQHLTNKLAGQAEARQAERVTHVREERTKAAAKKEAKKELGIQVNRKKKRSRPTRSKA
jgi:ABC-type dipeptide/oligopeptide/nickel transport system ATPase component